MLPELTLHNHLFWSVWNCPQQTCKCFLNVSVSMFVRFWSSYDKVQNTGTFLVKPQISFYRAPRIIHSCTFRLNLMNSKVLMRKKIYLYIFQCVVSIKTLFSSIFLIFWSPTKYPTTKRKALEIVINLQHICKLIFL